MPKPRTTPAPRRSNFRAIAGVSIATAVLGSIAALGVAPDADAANGLGPSISTGANGLGAPANGLGANGL